MGHPAIAPGRVAVVTGAGRGIGRAFARRFAAADMRVALLDVDAERLHETRAELGCESQGILCDVSELESLEHARDRLLVDWGEAPSVLVNNAVTRVGRGLDAPLADWRRATEVNLWGVIYGVRAFAPAMQAAGRPGVIVNLGSKQGITNPPGHPAYNMAKAAVRIYTECLEHELRQEPGRQVTAHLLVPGWTHTSEGAAQPGAWLPEQVVDHALAALAAGTFYIICPDGEVSEDEDRFRIAWAAEDITQGRPPLSRWHPDWHDTFTRAKRR